MNNEKKSALDCLNSYIKRLSTSKELTAEFAQSLQRNKFIIISRTISASRRTGESHDDIIQNIVIRLWKSMKDFSESHYTLDRHLYLCVKETEDLVLLRRNGEKAWFEKSGVDKVNKCSYNTFVAKRIHQICEDFVTHFSRIKRGSKVKILSMDSEDDDNFSLQDVIPGGTPNPEDALMYREMRDSVLDGLSKYALKYFKAMEVLPPGPLEGWKKPTKMYKKELEKGRVELYRAFRIFKEGGMPSITTDMLMSGVKDPEGPFERFPVYIKASALRR